MFSDLIPLLDILICLSILITYAISFPSITYSFVITELLWHQLTIHVMDPLYFIEFILLPCLLVIPELLWHQWKPYYQHISQTKYIKYMLKRFKMEDSKPISTPMVISCKLRKNDESLKVDNTMYRSMIGILLYVTSTRPYQM